MLKMYEGQNTIDGLKKEIGKNRTVVNFFATWCGPCTMQSGVYEDINHNDFNIIKIDIDKYRDLAVEMGVRSVPTLFLYNNGKLVNKNIGFLNAENFNKWVFSAA